MAIEGEPGSDYWRERALKAEGALARARAAQPALADHLDLAAARQERDAWRECALYDPMMEGPRFKGWDRSALDRCRKQYIEAAIRRRSDGRDG